MAARSPPGKLGVAIATGPGRAAALTPHVADVPEFLVPTRIDGACTFTLFAVWTVSSHKYVRGLNHGLAAYADRLKDQDVVVAKLTWDKEHPKDLNHSAMLRKMDEFGLASAYHWFTGEQHGHESQNTFFHHRSADKPHHIDYCFLPKRWTPRITAVRVEPFAEWRSLSDHCPLVVDLAHEQN